MHILKESKNKINLISLRKTIQMVISIIIFFLLQAHLVTIGTIIIIGSLLGFVLGKVFCRWMCPMGLLMEAITGATGEEKAKSLYMYHKLGCPIAWVSGLLNHISLMTIKHRVTKECKECGLCDKACYITLFNKKYSLYQKDKQNPADSYTCSRCLECIASCPTGRLSVQLRK